MKIIFETERLILRELVISDAGHFYKLNSDPEVIKYTGDVPFNSLDEARIFLENYTEYSTNGYGRWAVLSKEDNEFLGWCGLKLNEENMIDLGFRLHKIYWGNGFATEAASACLNYGFSVLKLPIIIGRTLIENAASIQVLKKIGMTYWKETNCHDNQKCLYYRIESNKLSLCQH